MDNFDFFKGRIVSDYTEGRIVIAESDVKASDSEVRAMLQYRLYLLKQGRVPGSIDIDWSKYSLDEYIVKLEAYLCDWKG